MWVEITDFSIDVSMNFLVKICSLPPNIILNDHLQSLDVIIIIPLRKNLKNLLLKLLGDLQT